MGRLQDIEQRLASINDAVFQELCDSFLALRNPNYAAFVRVGSQSGKQKTRKGTPDALILLRNNRYLFVEHSTNTSLGVKKLIRDLKQCLNEKTHGIPTNQIDEIIFCINFRLSPQEIRELNEKLTDTRIILTVYSLDSLSIELFLHHRDLVHRYLGLPLDSGQIVSIDTFIREYDRAANGIATPLNNVFLHRTSELAQLIETVNSVDFIIVTGPPGVGKTKLCIEAMGAFLDTNPNFKAYCISYKNFNLLDDLYQYFDKNGNYLMFVDDANRIDCLNQIIGFYKSDRKGKLKIIVTVRDYAYPEVCKLFQQYSPAQVELSKLTDQEIIDIIKEKPFDIQNQIYYDKITNIANGNPRIAIMTALLAKATQNVNALSNVSDLFDKYFLTFVNDEGQFANPLNIKCLGLISFFHAIPYKNKEIVNPILDSFNINYFEFIETVDKLEQLELVEVRFDYVKILEQNLAVYFFYKAFIKDNLLPFNVLLANFFEKNSSRFKDNIVPANNTFGPIEVMNKIKPELQRHLNSIRSSEETFTFLESFYYYLQEETLGFVYQHIDSLPVVDSCSKFTFSTDTSKSSKNRMINLLSEFFFYYQKVDVSLSDVLELGFEFVRKTPQLFSEFVQKIQRDLSFNVEDADYNFYRQRALFELLLKGIANEDNLYLSAFCQLARTFLSFTFQQVWGGRNNVIHWHSYSIPNSNPIKELRTLIWETIDYHFEKFQENMLDLLENYASRHPNVVGEIMQFDVKFVLKIINNHLRPDSFKHCKYVQDQVSWFAENSIEHVEFELLRKKFKNKLYEISLKLSFETHNGRNSVEYANLQEFQEQKENDIRQSFIFDKKWQISEFYDEFEYLRSNSRSNWSYNNALDLIIDENAKNNLENGLFFLELIINRNNNVEFIPSLIFKNHLNLKSKEDVIWSLIQTNNFRFKSQWELSFFCHIDENLIKIEHASRLLQTVKDVNGIQYFFFDNFEKFQLVKADVFHDLIKAVFENNTANDGRLQILTDDFVKHSKAIQTDLELIASSYLQQKRLQRYFDYDGEAFRNILNASPGFLLTYIDDIFSNSSPAMHSDSENLGFVWMTDNIEAQLETVLDVVIKKEPYYGIGKHFYNSFFVKISPEYRKRAELFLVSQIESNISDHKKINVIVDVARHSMRDMFEKVLLTYLSLTQDANEFSKILWRGNGSGGIGPDLILADIEAADWKNILSIVESSNQGIRLIPVKNYLMKQIERCLRHGEIEREHKFLMRSFY